MDSKTDSKSFVIKGDVCYSVNPQEVSCTQDGYLVCIGGKSAGVFVELQQSYADPPLIDCTGQLVVPGMSDIHVHAPQYAFRGLGMDLELLDWLNTHTFPEEAKYADLAYAGDAYEIFADDLRHSATTRAVVFGTLHVPATELLMDDLEATGLVTYVGKVNMDRNSPDNLAEGSEESAEATRRWVADVAGRYERTHPIITPRFTPSVTDGLMAELADIAHQNDLPVQSHLSENLSEIGWVKELCPWSLTTPPSAPRETSPSGSAWSATSTWRRRVATSPASSSPAGRSTCTRQHKTGPAPTRPARRTHFSPGATLKGGRDRRGRAVGALEGVSVSGREGPFAEYAHTPPSFGEAKPQGSAGQDPAPVRPPKILP